MPADASARRTALAEAAVTVLARSGARMLTHRAVEAAAGLPPGSASNVFRTRAALVEGVIEHLLALDDERLRRLAGTASPGSVAAEFVSATLADGGREVLARTALLSDPDADGLLDARERLVAAVDRSAPAGAALRPGGARLLIAAIDGMLLDAARSGTVPDAALVTASIDAMNRALR